MQNSPVVECAASPLSKFDSAEQLRNIRGVQSHVPPDFVNEGNCLALICNRSARKSGHSLTKFTRPFLHLSSTSAAQTQQYTHITIESREAHSPDPRKVNDCATSRRQRRVVPDETIAEPVPLNLGDSKPCFIELASHNRADVLARGCDTGGAGGGIADDHRRAEARQYLGHGPAPVEGLCRFFTAKARRSVMHQIADPAALTGMAVWRPEHLGALGQGIETDDRQGHATDCSKTAAADRDGNSAEHFNRAQPHKRDASGVTGQPIAKELFFTACSRIAVAGHPVAHDRIEPIRAFLIRWKRVDTVISARHIFSEGRALYIPVDRCVDADDAGAVVDIPPTEAGKLGFEVANTVAKRDCLIFKVLPFGHLCAGMTSHHELTANRPSQLLLARGDLVVSVLRRPKRLPHRSGLRCIVQKLQPVAKREVAFIGEKLKQKARPLRVMPGKAVEQAILGQERAIEDDGQNLITQWQVFDVGKPEHLIKSDIALVERENDAFSTAALTFGAGHIGIVFPFARANRASGNCCQACSSWGGRDILRHQL
ncbi:hypothetical protein BV379_10340 [Rhodovulum sulfidophilum]|nr:hypothetical protein BV379_10340 [Rhodovulum sulfidophilum]